MGGAQRMTILQKIKEHFENPCVLFEVLAHRQLTHEYGEYLVKFNGIMLGFASLIRAVTQVGFVSHLIHRNAVDVDNNQTGDGCANVVQN